MQGEEGSCRPGGQSRHLFLEQELVIRAGSLHSVLRDASFSALFSLRVGGSECVYTGLEEQGLRAVKVLLGHFYFS